MTLSQNMDHILITEHLKEFVLIISEIKTVWS